MTTHLTVKEVSRLAVTVTAPGVLGRFEPRPVAMDEVTRSRNRVHAAFRIFKAFVDAWVKLSDETATGPPYSELALGLNRELGRKGKGKLVGRHVREALELSFGVRRQQAWESPLVAKTLTKLLLCGTDVVATPERAATVATANVVIDQLFGDHSPYLGRRSDGSSSDRDPKGATAFDEAVLNFHRCRWWMDACPEGRVRSARVTAVSGDAGFYAGTSPAAGSDNPFDACVFAAIEGGAIVRFMTLDPIELKKNGLPHEMPALTTAAEARQRFVHHAAKQGIVDLRPMLDRFIVNRIRAAACVSSVDGKRVHLAGSHLYESLRFLLFEWDEVGGAREQRMFTIRASDQEGILPPAYEPEAVDVKRFIDWRDTLVDQRYSRIDDCGIGIPAAGPTASTARRLVADPHESRGSANNAAVMATTVGTTIQRSRRTTPGR